MADKKGSVILFIVLFLYFSFILFANVKYNDLKREKLKYEMNDLVCEKENGEFLNSSKEYFHEFKNKHTKLKTSKFKITITCMGIKND